MSNIQTGAERMPHDLSHLGFLAGQIGRLITISTTPVIAGDSLEMDAVGALRLYPLRRGLAIDSTVDIFTFYVPHRDVYGDKWIKFMKHGINATHLPTVNTTGYIDHAAFLGTINPDTNKILFFSSRRRHTILQGDWSSDVCSSDLLILWCLILRGISLEVGGHINDRMWQGFWDFVFVLANTLLAIVFGAAAGNMARGVPLEIGRAHV